MKRKSTPKQQTSWPGGAAFILCVVGVPLYGWVLGYTNSLVNKQAQPQNWLFVLPGFIFLLAGILLATYVPVKQKGRIFVQAILVVSVTALMYGLAVLTGFFI